MSGISLGRVTTLLLLGRAAGYVLALANSVILVRLLGLDRLRHGSPPPPHTRNLWPGDR